MVTFLTILVIFQTLLIISIGWCLVRLFLSARKAARAPEEEKSEEATASAAASAASDPSTAHSALLSLLKNLGCGPELREEGQWTFNYQGMHFLLEGPKSSFAIRLVLPWIFSEEASKQDSVHSLLSGLNQTMTQNWGGKLVWGIGQGEDKEVFVVSQVYDMMLSPNPISEDMLRAILGSFFENANKVMTVCAISDQAEEALRNFDILSRGGTPPPFKDSALN